MRCDLSCLCKYCTCYTKCKDINCHDCNTSIKVPVVACEYFMFQNNKEDIQDERPKDI